MRGEALAAPSLPANPDAQLDRAARPAQQMVQDHAARQAAVVPGAGESPEYAVHPARQRGVVQLAGRPGPGPHARAEPGDDASEGCEAEQRWDDERHAGGPEPPRDGELTGHATCSTARSWAVRQRSRKSRTLRSARSGATS